MLETGKPIFSKGRDAVLEGDPVLCPRGKNRVIVGINPRVWITANDTGGARGVASTTSNSPGNEPL